MNRHSLGAIAGAPDRPLVIGDIEIPCYVLEDETRVLSQRGMFRALGASRGSRHNDNGARRPRIMASKALSPFIPEDLAEALEKPIRFKRPEGGLAYGYPATLLVDICETVLRARDDNALQWQQLGIAKRCDILIRGIARVGIIALVDEATGYEEIRAQRALATILEEFIAKELQPWTKTFPFEFYEQIFRLKQWPVPEGTKRPSVIGRYTNDLVYERLAPGVLEELRRKNPVRSGGGRKSKHHQWFTPDLGHPKLKEHLAAVIALMKAASNWSAFKRSLQRAFPKQNETVPLPLDD